MYCYINYPQHIPSETSELDQDCAFWNITRSWLEYLGVFVTTVAPHSEGPMGRYQQRHQVVKGTSINQLLEYRPHKQKLVCNVLNAANLWRYCWHVQKWRRLLKLGNKVNKCTVIVKCTRLRYDYIIYSSTVGIAVTLITKWMNTTHTKYYYNSCRRLTTCNQHCWCCAHRYSHS